MHDSKKVMKYVENGEWREESEHEQEVHLVLSGEQTKDKQKKKGSLSSFSLQ